LQLILQVDGELDRERKVEEKLKENPNYAA